MPGLWLLQRHPGTINAAGAAGRQHAPHHGPLRRVGLAVGLGERGVRSPGRRRCGEASGVAATSTRASGHLQPALPVLVPWRTDGMMAEDSPASLPLDTPW